ncbi:ATP-dependent exoDNAse (exonuclease V) beta subunit (contains helicase and exonuclease domains) [Fontimonas thermophila]|uniref:DNA 3'-5' helicase n=1 Tax=Fontimonas thermophila TaxID=1076937 RepID=A0A1I2J1I5_9GAMM|nr:UvrD-helicase domain-containing protein [Fontimonas thermophila]SFF47733.1 ATP-dependent exoDNAse (exonuclease V) beta subunit (contains helicase and exonuclease domains) [Fontimonas thermophila]
MSMDIADAAERAAALDPARSFIVQAPAGSGKTELLTQRLLVLLARVDEPEEVVAMTFTRKAAAEMRQRLFASIRRALDDLPPEDAHKRLTWELARAVLERSRRCNWRLEDNPQRLRILTIDALCAQIAQQSPLTTGFGGRITVTELAEPLYREAARTLIQSLEHDPPYAPVLARVLRHFDNRVGVLEQQLVRLLARRDQWLRLVTQDGRADHARDVLQETLEWIIDDALHRCADLVPPDLAARWCESAAYVASVLAPGDAVHPLHGVRRAGWPEPRAAYLHQWLALIDLVCTQQGNWRQKVDKRQGFVSGTADAGARKQAHLELIEQLAQCPGLLEALQAVRRLPAPRYADAQWEVLQALLETLRLAAAHLRIVFATRGEVDFAEVAMQAVAALGDPAEPSDLALRLDYRLRHLLIDEFQDTSELQWQLLLRLTAGWSAGDGRTLFIVGDPMQSIYRFREADVGLYLRAWRDGIGPLRLEPLTLRCNFRSQAGIVDWVNAVFPRVLPQRADPNRSAVPYSAAIATRGADASPAVTLHAFADANAEAARVVEIVRAQHAADAQASIAILVRSRGHLEQIVPALRAAGIAYRAVDIESLAERPVIDDLRALTRALLHPMERTAWLALLRAPWCGLTLADLHALYAQWPQHRPVLAALRDHECWTRLSEDGRARLAPVLRVLEAAVAEQGRWPLRRWVESTWLALGGPACVGSEAALADAAAFFNCLQQLAPGAQLDDLAALDRALEALKASPDADAAGTVTLMTIHKSKGLEFDTVIVPGLGRSTRVDEQPPVIWAQLSDVGGNVRLVLAPVHATGDERDAIYEFVRTLDADKQRLEDARLLYVATTRARRHLHLLGELTRAPDGGEVRPPRSGSLLARLWPALAEDFQQALSAGAPAANAAAEPPPEPPLRRLLDWSAPEPPPGLPLPEAIASDAGETLRFDWAGETARCVGIVFHRWIQFIAEDGLARWDPARCASLDAALRAELRREGVPAARVAAAAARVREALCNTLTDARGRWLLDPSHRDAVSELALSTVLGGRLRRLVVDRSFVDADGVRWVVDFKTSVHEGGDAAAFVRQELQRYRAQLLGYCAALRQLDRQRPLRAALYLPLIENPDLRWVELGE